MKVIISTKLKIVIMVGMVVMGVHGTQESVDGSNKRDFEQLCKVILTARGVSQTVADVDVDSEEFMNKIRELNHIGDEIFFGSKSRGIAQGTLILPQTFAGEKPNRRNVCVSNRISDNMPSAWDSLASAIFCLCTDMDGIEKDFCAPHIVGGGKWADDGGENAQDIFENIWGNGFHGMVIDKCEAKDELFENLEHAEKNITEIIENIKSYLEAKKGILGKKGNACDGTTPCANVTKTPTWLKKLEEIKEITKIAMSHLDAQKKESERKQRVAEMERLASNTAAVRESKHESAPSTPPPHSPSSPQAPVDTQAQETRKAPLEEPKPQPKAEPEKLLEDTPQKTAEKTGNKHTIPENETEGTYIKIQRWLLINALLI